MNDTPERVFTGWRKSRHSDTDGNCVQVARAADGTVGVRDSKNPDGGHLEFAPAAWASFTGVTTHHGEHLDGAPGGVVIEYLAAEQVPAVHREGGKVFAPGEQAIAVSAAHEAGRLYFTPGEWAAFGEGLGDGEFRDLLDEGPGDAEDAGR